MKKEKIAFYDTKGYDKQSFDELNQHYQIKYFDNKLNADTAILAKGCSAVIAFVNDELNEEAINKLYEIGVRAVAMRCAGFNNVDVKAAYKKLNIMRVPAYSPYAVAEHGMALLLALNRKIHKAYNRTRDFNFSLNGLIGFDLKGKKVGVIGTGKIGQIFIKICKGFDCEVLAYDPFPNPSLGINYVSLPQLYKQSDIISLHCPLTDDTRHLINEDSIALMKKGVIIINTSRGGLIESKALLSALQNGIIGGAGLDVYEEEADLFFEDKSQDIIQDDILSLLLSLPNVIVTSHQAFLTKEALQAIAQTTFKNLDDFYSNDYIENEVCYHCLDVQNAKKCRKESKKRCF